MSLILLFLSLLFCPLVIRWNLPVGLASLHIKLVSSAKLKTSLGVWPVWLYSKQLSLAETTLSICVLGILTNDKHVTIPLLTLSWLYKMIKRATLACHLKSFTRSSWTDPVKWLLNSVLFLDSTCQGRFLVGSLTFLVQD